MVNDLRPLCKIFSPSWEQSQSLRPMKASLRMGIGYSIQVIYGDDADENYDFKTTGQQGIGGSEQRSRVVARQLSSSELRGFFSFKKEVM